MAGGALGAAEDLDQRSLGRLEAQLLRDLRVDLLFEVVRREAGEQAVARPIESDDKMGRLDRAVVLEHFEHVERVSDPGVERVDLRGLGEDLPRPSLVPQSHGEHAEPPRRGHELWHPAARLFVVAGGIRVLRHQVEAGREARKERAAVRIAPDRFGDHRLHARAPVLAVDPVERAVGGGQPAERLLVGGIERAGPVQRRERPAGTERGHLQVGAELVRLLQPWIDRERALDRGARRIEIELLDRNAGPCRMHLRGVRVDRHGRVQLARGVARVVLLDEEPRRLEVSRPVGRIARQRVGEEGVDEEVELRGVPVPARVLRAGEADPAEHFGIDDAVLLAVVVADEPEIAVVRGVQPAGDAIELSGEEVRRGLVRIVGERGIDEVFRGVVIAAFELELCFLGEERDSVRMLRRRGGEHAERLLRIADRVHAAREPDRRGDGLTSFEPGIGLASLGVVAGEEQLSRGRGFALGAQSVRRSEDDEAGRKRDERELRVETSPASESGDHSVAGPAPPAAPSGFGPAARCG